MRVLLIAYGCWALQGLGIFLWASRASTGGQLPKEHEDEWMLYLQ
jgi:hypothetical protein